MASQDTVTRVTLGEKTIILVGTAHVSKESVTEVETIIRDEEPDRVCVEIDEGRYRALTSKQDWSSIDIYQVIRERKVLFLLGNYVLSSFQRRLGLDLGVKPGEEMIKAIDVAEELDIPFSLCDREIQITLRRAWRLASFWGKAKMLAALLSSAFTSEELTAEDIEQLKVKGAVEGMMSELASYLPRVKSVLIDERDRYLATKIFEAEGQRVVAVVGAGHVGGIVSWLESLQDGNADADLAPIETVPPPGVAAKIAPWILPAVIVSLIVWGFFRSGLDGGLEILLRWILVNGTLSAIGAIAALAHPVTVVASFAAAPITSMNPTIGVGMVSAAVEAFMRKPRVQDFEALSEDTATIRGFFRNRFTKILVVFLLSTIGSAIGTFIAIPFLFPGA